VADEASGIVTAESIEHARRIGEMFGRIARRYDLMNRLMTAGQDQRWRQLAVTAVLAGGARSVLDVGTGTGDLALALAAQPQVERVVGVDIAPPMLALAQRKAGDGALPLALASAAALPFHNASFDAATSAFVVRNIRDLGAALREIRRVLRPGGRYVCLEITRLDDGPRARLFRLYFDHLVPRLGGLIAGDPEAYSYLPDSVHRFLSARELARAMLSAGFTHVCYRYVGPGGVALHIAET
jgi:demethylmenaquinone methyltransferase/2-methoxy-6-polyprenyl-1,4-benzoquinol methylase